MDFTVKDLTLEMKNIFTFTDSCLQNDAEGDFKDLQRGNRTSLWRKNIVQSIFTRLKTRLEEIFKMIKVKYKGRDVIKCY